MAAAIKSSVSPPPSDPSEEEESRREVHRMVHPPKTFPPEWMTYDSSAIFWTRHCNAAAPVPPASRQQAAMEGVRVFPSAGQPRIQFAMASLLRDAAMAAAADLVRRATHRVGRCDGRGHVCAAGHVHTRLMGSRTSVVLAVGANPRLDELIATVRRQGSILCWSFPLIQSRRSLTELWSTRRITAVKRS